MEAFELIKELKKQLGEVRECMTQVTESARDVGELVEDSSDKSKKQIEELEVTLGNLIIAEMKINYHIEAIEKVCAEVNSRSKSLSRRRNREEEDDEEEEDDDDDEVQNGQQEMKKEYSQIYEDTLSQIQQELTKEEEERVIRNHDKMKEFHVKLWIIHHPGQPMPSNIESNNSKGGDEEEEEDLAIVPVVGPIQLVCPITRQPFVDPVKK